MRNPKEPKKSGNRMIDAKTQKNQRRDAEARSFIRFSQRLCVKIEIERGEES